MSASEPLFKDAATDSIQLVVELFNRPHDTGRDCATLILLNHSLEMLLKSIVKDHGVDIRKDNGHTIDFSDCINYLENGHHDAPELAVLSEDQAVTLYDISSQRNEATHGIINISEQRLHGFARSGLTIFDELLKEFYDESVGDYIPDRVLPLSAMPLKRLDIIYQEEFDTVQELLEQGAEEAAKVKLRSIEASERTLEDGDGPVTDEELEEKLSHIEEGDELSELYPGVSSVQFSVDSDGPTVKVKMTRNEGMPVMEVTEEDTEDLEDVVGYREVNPLDRYSLSITKLASHIDGVTQPKVWALVRHMDIHENPEYHKNVRTSDSQTQDRYTDRAITVIRDALDNGEVDPDEAWEEHGYM
jgi:BMFP domain-containing protein YqiC